jgi:hypothetical protein
LASATMLHRRDAVWEGNRVTKGRFEKTVVSPHGLSRGLAKLLLYCVGARTTKRAVPGPADPPRIVTFTVDCAA